MSTQHPDNVTIPFFADDSILSGEDEIKEAYYVFSHLGCTEQMWDCEGKEVDEYVIKKLLTRYDQFFEHKRLGRDLFLTLRVPNPIYEKQEAKILLETLESIPRSFDTARLIYNDDLPPIFEVILPMTTSADALNQIYYYYRDFVSGKQNRFFYPGNINIREWIGEFKPEKVMVIPLVEDIPYLLGIDRLVRDYLKEKSLPYLRVFLARSDPALNYGILATVLVLKIALISLHTVEQQLGIPIYPILGVGSCPFRGNFNPVSFENCLRGYPSVQTFTIQSAFKYDYDEQSVMKAIEKIYQKERSAPLPIDEDQAKELIEKSSQSYRQQVYTLAPLVNEVSRYIPARRMRKLHIGLFGYSREVGRVHFPRVITFCAALYSIGLPPELIGLSSLSVERISSLRKMYPGFDQDLKDAAQYWNPECKKLIPLEVFHEIEKGISFIEYTPDPQHLEITTRIIRDLSGKNDSTLQELAIRAGKVRRFLG